jgi:PTS system nitrogen regulatory IIA component
MNLISKILLPDNILLDSESPAKTRVRARRCFKTTSRSPAAVFDTCSHAKAGSTAGARRGIRTAVLRSCATRPRICENRTRSRSGTGWDAGKLIFVLLVPDRATDVHLQILGELAQMFSDAQFRNRLLACEDAVSIHQLFYDWNSKA